MKALPLLLLTVLSTMLLTFFLLSLLWGAPNPADSRGLLLIAIGVAGVCFAAMSIKELLRVNRLLS